MAMLSKPKFGLKKKLGLSFALLALVCVASTCAGLYLILERQTILLLQHQLIDYATLMATKIDPGKIVKIKSDEDKARPEFEEIQDLLHSTRLKTIDISNIYTFRLSRENVPVFIVDEPAEPEKNKDCGKIGELIADPDNLWANRLATPILARKPHADDFISSDRFGRWLSGFAPIFNEKGEPVAYLGVDMDADHVARAQHLLAMSAIGLFMILLPLAIILGWFIGCRLVDPLTKLKENVLKVQAMDFDTEIPKGKEDEIGELGAAINAMRISLRDATRKLKESTLALEEKNMFFRQFLEAMPYPVFCKDAKGHYLECNTAFANSFAKMPKDLIIGNTVAKLPQVIDLKLHASIDDALFKGEKQSVAYEAAFAGDNGMHYTLIYKAAFHLPDGSIGGLVGAIIDITDRKNLETEMKLAKITADNANNAKSRFLVNVSHEIRTPLNGIVGIAELLRETPLDEQQKALLDTLDESGKILMTVINDILDLAKIESGNMILDEMPCNLNDIIASLEKSFQEKAARKNVIIKTVPLAENDGPWVFCDPVRVKQILENIVSNAVKFTNDGFIEIKAERLKKQLTEESPALYRISVKDTGIGIDKEKLASIFESFSMDNVLISRNYVGCGIGLSICKDLVLLMGGTIKAESIKGGGSTFLVEIPLKDALAQNDYVVERLQASQLNLKGKRALVVDDHIPSVKVMRSLLESLGCLCTESYGCSTAIDLLKSEHFDLLVIDLSMTDGFGYNVAKSLRNFESISGAKRTFILAATTNALENAREKGRECGIDEFLLKPITKKHLVAALLNYEKQDGQS